MARHPAPAEPTREERLAAAAEEALRVAVDDVIRANRGLERKIRLADKHGLSQRRIFDLTGINRKRIKRIIATVEDTEL